MTVAQLLVTLLRGTHKDFYDALLQNLHVHEGVDDLDVDTLLMAVRQAPRLEEIGASEGWGCFWMDLCAVVSSSSTRLLMGQEIARRGFGRVLDDSLVPRTNVFFTKAKTCPGFKTVLQTGQAISQTCGAGGTPNWFCVKPFCPIFWTSQMRTWCSFSSWERWPR